MKFPVTLSHVSPVFPLFILLWSLYSAITSVSGASHAGLCEETCDKYRPHSGAYTLDCTGRDPACATNCRYCDIGVCNWKEPRKVYHCPSKYLTVLIVVLSSAGIFLVVAATLLCLFCIARRKDKYEVPSPSSY